MSSGDIELHLATIRHDDPARHTLLLRVRRLVLGTDPSIREQLKYGGLLYSAGPPFCGLFSYPKHLALEFSRGAELADPHQVLEGVGKLRRHIKLRVDGDLFGKNVQSYVQAAFDAAAKVAARRDPRAER